MDTDSGQELWFTRRNGEVRGPHPSGLISRFLIIGRLTPEDEVSPDRESWQPIREHPQLIPEELKHADTQEGRERLLQARLREDERLHERRASGGAAAESAERRGLERRRPEPPEVISHRTQRAQWLRRPGNRLDAAMRGPTPWILAASTTLLAVLLFFWATDRDEPPSPPACHLPPAPEVNWSYCRMPGLDLRGVDLSHALLRNTDLLGSRLDGARLLEADLSYADLQRTRLERADLRRARMTGASMQNATLTDARLDEADLSFVNLTGASIEGAALDGAILDRAVWIDGRICATGSVGTCD
ncbi:MAG: pentapeptide repeat-containing protein [Thioalkalivibrio sp.]|nr:MAG: pentapeptide repeat-containing protein [Thioalkalivibrio sp.]